MESIMSQWIECTLNDIGEIVGGSTPLTAKKEYYGGEIPWITPKDLSSHQNRYIAKGERNITKAGLNSCSATLLPKNTILFTSRAPIGYVAISSTELCTNQGFKSIIPKEEVDNLFVYYLLVYNRNKIISMGSGTTFKEVSGKVMKSIEVKIPQTFRHQKKIASILGRIDDKIELNNKINDNLAELLQALYQQQFCCSNCTDNQGRLADLCDYSKAKVAVTELSLSTYYSTENMLPGKAGAVDAANLPTTTQVIKCQIGDVLISNIRPYFKKIVYCHSNCGCSMDVLCFTPKLSQLSAYLYSVLYADSFFDFMVAGSKGTKMPRGDKQQIMTYAVHIPTKEEIKVFNALAMPILEQIENTHRENMRLSSLRDSLLPKLMSGELDVSELDI